MYIDSPSSTSTKLSTVMTSSTVISTTSERIKVRMSESVFSELPKVDCHLLSAPKVDDNLLSEVPKVKGGNPKVTDGNAKVTCGIRK